MHAVGHIPNRNFGTRPARKQRLKNPSADETVEGTHGVHVMAFRQEEVVAEIIQRSGLFPRRSRRELPRQSSTEMLLPETPLNGALVIAERIRKKVEDYEFIAQNVAIRLTVSLGVAELKDEANNLETLLDYAERALAMATGK